MPLPLIPTVLVVGFALVWAFVGGMILRDTHAAARQVARTESDVLPLATHRPETAQPGAVKQDARPRTNRRRPGTLRAAS